jgi:hypothetical protein
MSTHATNGSRALNTTAVLAIYTAIVLDISIVITCGS